MFAAFNRFREKSRKQIIYDKASCYESQSRKDCIRFSEAVEHSKVACRANI